MAKTKGSYHPYQNTGYVTGGPNSITNPQKIKCNGCSVVKPPAGFSSKKLEILQSYIILQKNKGKTFDAAKQQYIPCVGCTAKQPVEMTCYYCDKTKALDKFSLAQRKKRDTAECWKCAKIREGVEPDENDSDSSGSGSGEESGGSSEVDEHSGGVSFDDDKLTSTMGSTSLTDTRSTYPSSTSRSSTGGGVSLGNSAPTTNTYTSSTTRSTAGGNTPNTVKSNSTTGNATIPVAPGFNANKYRTAPSSDAGSTTSNQTARKKGGGWAKPESGLKAKQNVSEPEDDEDKDVLSSDSD
ncbi:uncharacterized protein MYCGRDRAFT_93022 [Zymoseptoria tritici IPO323]|uniref:Stc1 domain-containing protein n=1 Tax=Zymoseptoria tritici (strain CBS 115943 / IPO323) TaxID=336722 RepID=F9XAS6_ZYMTI|nr:uncharacterized protein MYCGRDRAFT_93022 [Zymoseptoria tritici IPO323]EGP87720.1 hypothetical protein MYCGRDRAFT_93022 [Zymoseptoria tritici IPO323]